MQRQYSVKSTHRNLTIKSHQDRFYQSINRPVQRTIRSAFPSSRKSINVLNNARGRSYSIDIKSEAQSFTKSLQSQKMKQLGFILSQIKQKDQYISQGIFQRALNDQFTIQNQFKPSFGKQVIKKGRKKMNFYNKDQFNNNSIFLLDNYSRLYKTNLNLHKTKQKCKNDVKNSKIQQKNPKFDLRIIPRKIDIEQIKILN